VPGFQLLKLNPGANVRISRTMRPTWSQGPPDLAQIDRTTQLGHVRITLNKIRRSSRHVRARNIDAKRSCGVAVPRTAIDRLTLQVVKGNTVETRKVRVGLTSDTSTES